MTLRHQSTSPDLEELARELAAPKNYFTGIQAEPWSWPNNLLLFSRATAYDLQRRTLESQPHHRHVFIINLRGEGTVNLDGNAYPLKPGHAQLIFPYQFHTYHNIEGSKILWIFVTFEPRSPAAFEPLRHCVIRLSMELISDFRQLIADYHDRSGRCSNQVILLRAARLLALLVHKAQDSSRLPQNSTSYEAERLRQRILKVHSQTLPEALSIQELAKKLHLSESRLRTVFRNTFGMSLGDYLRNLRLYQAVAMMRDSTASLTEVALSCGFSSSTAFSRSFRQWSGMTPREFRH